jgi:4-amino-4-deoxy-L-arabinose transferase-like glycosyltransferase
LSIGTLNPPGRSERLRASRVSPALVILLGALALRLPSFVHQLFDPDEGAIATMGMVVTRGGVLYRDVIDRKPPGAPFLYALSFTITGTRDLRPVHFIAAIELAACAFILASEARREGGRTAGWWAAGLFLAGAIAFAPTVSQAADFSQLALLPACGAIVAARRGSVRSSALAGTLLGLAVLTRQTWIIGLFPAAVAAWMYGGRRLSRAAIVVGSTAATIAAVAIVVPFGAFWHWTFTANGSLLADMFDSSEIVPRALASAGLFIAGHLVLCWLASRRGWQRRDLDLWLWVATGLLAVAVGFRFFAHYWFQVLPALCLLAAPVAATAKVNAKRIMVGVLAATTLFCWSVAWSPNKHANPANLVAAVRADTKPGDKITIWGSFPEVYWLSGREPGGAFVLSDFIVDRNGALTDNPHQIRHGETQAAYTFLHDLERDPPRLFLDTSTGDVRDYEHYPLRLVPAVAAFVHQNYRPLGKVEGVTIYRLVRPQ